MKVLFINIIEELISRMFEIGGITLPRPFPKITFDEAVNTYGTDRPDMRFGLKFIEATDLFKNTNYTIFKQILQRSGRIKGINVKKSSEKLSKNVLQNEYAKKIVPEFGAKGMTWMRFIDGQLESNIVQFFSEKEKQMIAERFGAENGDVILMIADPSYDIVTSALGQLRMHMAKRLNIIPVNKYCPVWVTEFPLFLAAEDGITSSHHPFTSPDKTDFNPSNYEELLSLKSRAYDIVINGEELGGGSIRINSSEVQHKIFEALGLTDKEVDEKFGFFTKALDFGAPPHGGLALGMDRVISMILGTESIREVIAFPKNRSAYCPLSQAPSTVAYEQLAELELFDLTAENKIMGSEQKDEIEYLSWVSRIGIDKKIKPAIKDALNDAKQLAEIVTEKAGKNEPVFAVNKISNRFRKSDTAKINHLAESGELLKNAPAVKGTYFKVSNIIE